MIMKMIIYWDNGFIIIISSKILSSQTLWPFYEKTINLVTPKAKMKFIKSGRKQTTKIIKFNVFTPNYFFFAFLKIQYFKYIENLNFNFLLFKN